MEKLKDILIIDDCPLPYRSFIDPLKERYNVVIATSLKGAQRQLLYRTFDLAIVDMMMPANGFDSIDDFHAGLMFYDSVIREKYRNMPTIIWSVIDEIPEYMANKEQLGEQVTNLYYCNKNSVSAFLRLVDSILNQ